MPSDAHRPAAPDTDADDAGNDAIDEIQRDVGRHFPDLDLSGFGVTGRVLRLGRLLDARREAQLAAHDLTGADFDVLASLRRTASDHPVNVRDLQRTQMLSSGGMTKRLDRLERAGLLERQRDPADRRGVLIGLTPAGTELIDRVLPEVLLAEDALVADALGRGSVRARTEEGLRRLLRSTDVT